MNNLKLISIYICLFAGCVQLLNGLPMFGFGTTSPTPETTIGSVIGSSTYGLSSVSPNTNQILTTSPFMTLEPEDFDSGRIRPEEATVRPVSLHPRPERYSPEPYQPEYETSPEYENSPDLELSQENENNQESEISQENENKQDLEQPMRPMPDFNGFGGIGGLRF